MTTRKIALTGIKPSGTPHVGNYLGMLKPALELATTYQAYYFIADYHALTTVTNGDDMRHLTYEVAATMLALGLNPDEVIFFRQSDIPELFEFTWILSCFAPKGLLNRAHAYKARVDDNLAAGRPPDDGINMGLFTYPVLMSADILMYGSHIVPVGQDQKQHVEIARDLAIAFNNNYGDILVVPEAVIREDVAVIPGVDGRKMSKSYGNVLPLFAPAKELRKAVMRIVTDSRPPEEPKNPDENNVYNIYKHFATPAQLAEMRTGFQHGGLGYGTAKQMLYELLEAQFGPARAEYDRLLANPAHLDTVLLAGAQKARAVATPMLARLRRAVGVGGLAT